MPNNSMALVIGAVVGGALDKRNRVRGATIGGVLGFLLITMLDAGVKRVTKGLVVGSVSPISGLGQTGPMHIEDPTGGAYGGGGDPIYGDPLGPGESIARATRWAADLHPRGFAATTI